MEQKLICVDGTSLASKRELQNYLDTGWKIAQIAGGGNGVSNSCWILLEKQN